MHYKILLVDDSPSSLARVKGLLESQGYPVETAQSGDEAIEKIRIGKGQYAVAIMDFMMEGKDGAKTTKEILGVHPDLNVIVLSADRSQEAVKDSWNNGAKRFVSRESEEELLKEVNDFYKQYEDAHAVILNSAKLQENETLIRSIPGLFGCSDGLAEVVERVKRFRAQKDDVRVEGETGVGKEGVARALWIGDASKAIFVNCADFNGSLDLMKSELFGHIRGSFTGAEKDKIGLFEEADGGVIILDELHRLLFQQQANLLRVLEEKKVRPVGGNREYALNFRVIVLCKPDLIQMVKRGEFMEDLYERFNQLVIEIPPLRERKEDIPLLSVHFLKQWELENKKRKSFLQGAITELHDYDWPRNVRELRHFVRRLATNVDGEKITGKDVKIALKAPADVTLNYEIEEITKERIFLAYKTAKLQNYSLRQAARRAGVPWATFQRKVSQYGLNTGS